MRDIYLDESTGDIAVVGNQVLLMDEEDKIVRQKLQIRLNTAQGEWFYDSEAGVPYFQEILKKPYQKNVVDAILRQTILETEGVTQLLSFNSEFIPSQRKYKLDFSVTTKKGLLNVSL